MLIKIDVEGHEPDVITGGRSVIHLYRPKILFEVCGKSSADVGCVWGNAIELLGSTYSTFHAFGPAARTVNGLMDLADALNSIVRDGRLHNFYVQ